LLVKVYTNFQLLHQPRMAMAPSTLRNSAPWRSKWAARGRAQISSHRGTRHEVSVVLWGFYHELGDLTNELLIWVRYACIYCVYMIFIGWNRQIH
jgi:hypothetical protein